MKKIIVLFFFCLNCSIVFAQRIFPFLEGSKYGFCDSVANIVIVPQYDEVMLFDVNGFANVCKDSLWSLIDKSGTVYLPFQSTQKYETESILNVKEENRYDYENRKYVKCCFSAHTEKDYNHFWLLNREKKKQQGYFFKGSQRIFNNYYKQYESNFSDNYLITLDKDTLQSVFDTLGNVLLQNVKDAQVLNQRFLSYENAQITFLYDAKTKKTYSLPYRNIKKTMNDTCFIVSNALNDSRGFPMKDSLKIINQFNTIFFADSLKNLGVISPSHYCQYEHGNSCNIEYASLFKIKNGSTQKGKYDDINKLDNSLIALCNKKRTQVINFENKVVFESEYDAISSPHHFSREKSKNYYQFTVGKYTLDVPVF